jgi:pimeloyl-ACP methyl ester carboxylesterase
MAEGGILNRSTGPSCLTSRRGVLRVTAGGVLALVLVTAAAVAAQGTVPPARPAAQGDFAGLIDIGGGRHLYMECHGIGTPTVVLVSGLRDRGDIWNAAPGSGSSTPNVFSAVGRFTRVCEYDRPGTASPTEKDFDPSRSDPVPQPTTARDAVADLHALLTAAGEAGPYVLVGHSVGGLISRLYTSIYPDDVAGLVLVDSLSEGLHAGLTPDQWARFEQLNAVRDPYTSYRDYEKIDEVRSFEQVEAADPVGGIPVVVLTADQSIALIIGELFQAGLLPSDMPASFGDALWQAQLAAQDALPRAFSNVQHITNTNAGHYIQTENPQLVIDSIREVVEKVRTGSP